MKKVLFITSLLASAAANAYTGNELLADLNSTSENKRNQAIGFVWGSVAFSSKVCLSPGISKKQAAEIVKSGLEFLPQYGDKDAGSLSRSFLSKVYPCK